MKKPIKAVIIIVAAALLLTAGVIVGAGELCDNTPQEEEIMESTQPTKAPVITEETESNKEELTAVDGNKWTAEYILGIKSYSSLQEIIVNNEDALVKKALKEADKIKNYIRNHNDAKIIALRPMSMGLTNIVTHFSTVSGAHHIEIVKNIVKSKYPSIYPSFESVIFSNKLHLGNMIICEKSVFNQYCSFVFSVLEEHRRILIEDGWYKDLKEYSISRLSGYIAEILTSVFVSYIEKTEGRRFVKLLTLLRAKI